MQALPKQLETGWMPGETGNNETSRTASVESIAPRIDTHWTRILYVDLLNAEREDAQLERPTAETKIMRTSTELHRLAAPDAAAFDAPVRGDAPMVFLTRAAASNDAAPITTATPRDELHAWTQRAVAAIGFGAPLDVVALTKPSAAELQDAARAYRSYWLGEILAELASETVAFVRDVCARWSKRHQARAIENAFRELDDRTLRDLGVDRSEIDSLMAEVSGDARRTRMLAVLMRNG